MATIAAVATPASAPAIERIDWAMNGVNIEIPSWGFVNTGTRFRVFPQQGVPRSVFEKIDDAATVNRYTGIAGSVSLHIPWDKVDDYAGLAAYAGERGLRHRRHQQQHVPGRGLQARVDLQPGRARAREGRGRDHRVLRDRRRDERPGGQGLAGRRHQLPGPGRPALAPPPAGRGPARRPTPRCPPASGCTSSTSSTSPPCTPPTSRTGARASTSCRQLGDQAGVCVDTGHHAMGVNIEQIVALLLAEGRLAAFDLNDKKYGDDDLMVGSIDPYQLFRIAHELVNAMRDEADPVAQACANETVYMLDQCHNIEPKVPAMIRSVMNLQETIAKALLVDRERAPGGPGRGRRARGEPLPAGRVLHRRAAAARGAAGGARPPGGPVPGVSRLRRGAGEVRRARRRHRRELVIRRSPADRAPRLWRPGAAGSREGCAERAETPCRGLDRCAIVPCVTDNRYR